MKQSDINRLVARARKDAGKLYDWKSSHGFLFKRKESLFFDLTILGGGKTNEISGCLSYKWLGFDEVFWSIVDLEENANQPLSFRAAGIWTAPTMTIHEVVIDNDDWGEKELSGKIRRIVRESEEMASGLAKRITCIDENLAYLEWMHAELLKRSPDTGRNIHKERMMTAVLKGDFSRALEIADERIAQHDSGGFLMPGGTFFTKARDCIGRRARSA